MSKIIMQYNSIYSGGMPTKHDAVTEQSWAFTVRSVHTASDVNNWYCYFWNYKTSHWHHCLVRCIHWPAVCTDRTVNVIDCSALQNQALTSLFNKLYTPPYALIGLWMLTTVQSLQHSPPPPPPHPRNPHPILSLHPPPPSAPPWASSGRGDPIFPQGI